MLVAGTTGNHDLLLDEIISGWHTRLRWNGVSIEPATSSYVSRFKQRQYVTIKKRMNEKDIDNKR